MTEKPTILISHGAWHGVPHFQPLIDRLQAHGYPVVCKLHPSCSDDEDFAQSSLYDDARALRLEAQALVEAGKRVVVIAHSYGGMVLTEGIVAELGFDKIKHQTGGVIGLVYVCAFIPPAGANLISMMSIKEGSKPANFSLDGGAMTFTAGPGAFYHDMEEDEQKHYYSLLRKMAARTFVDKVSRTAWTSFPTMYVYCTLDQAISLERQQNMVRSAAAAGGNLVREAIMDTAHSPFLKDPEALAGHIAGFTESLQTPVEG